MSDPSIQTFCCHKPGQENPALSIMHEFNSVPYNAVCLTSSIIGMLGAIYQLWPRSDTLSHRWFSLTAYRGRQIIIWLAFADLLASIGSVICVFARSAMKLNTNFLMSLNDSQTIVYCIILAAWIEYFYVVTWMWTLCYAIDMWRALQQKSGFPIMYHFICWTLPVVLTSTGLAILYIPNADCHNIASDESTFLRLLPNYFVTYIPIATVMIVNPILYMLSLRAVHRIIASCLSQVTKRERAIVNGVKIKFGVINLAFYACWLPNLLNGIIIWSSWFNPPRVLLLTIWYIMAVMNPLQALFNSLLYRHASQKLIIPFSMTPSEITPLIAENINA